MFYNCVNGLKSGCWHGLLTWSLCVGFVACSTGSTTASSVRVFDGITEASVVSHFISNNSRAINSTGLWSKYNLIVKPTVVTVTRSPVAAFGPSTTPESRYRPVEISSEGEDDDDEDGDRDEFQGESENDDEESQEEDETGEEDDYYVSSTTQRASHRPPPQIKKKKPRPPLPAQILQVVPQTVAPVKPLVTPHHRPLKDKGGIIRKTRKKTIKLKKGLKKLKKYMLPLLLAYKLKFFTLIPLLLGGLVVIVASTGFAGFFFALFAVGVGLKKD